MKKTKSREHFTKTTYIEQSPTEVFRWHARPGALERLTPPWEDVRITESSGPLKSGLRVVLQNRVGPLHLEWIADHVEVIEGQGFTDVMSAGPFSSWRHEHRFEKAGSGCRLVDEIQYQLPGGTLGRLLAGRFVKNKLDRMFAFRHRITEQDLATHAKGDATMKVLIGGSTGMLGNALTAFLSTGGHETRRLVRPSTTAIHDTSTVAWAPTKGEIAQDALEGVDAVVHLGGVNLANHRWTSSFKRAVRDSRVISTRLLAETIARAPIKPKTFICASGISIYGDGGAEPITEQNRIAEGFLAEVCQAWEDATQPARDAGVRVVNLRIGIVLSPKGGALPKFLLPFRLGLGGPFGDGTQVMSWISIEDAVGAIHHALTHSDLEGPINVTAPHPVTNRTFSKTLGRVLSRPAILPVPKVAARLILGKERATDFLFTSAHVLPSKLEASGYTFRHPHLEGALEALLGVTEKAGVPD